MDENKKNDFITIAQIANIAGVSSATVSYVLNERKDVKISPETRDKILEVCREYRYKPYAKRQHSSDSSKDGKRVTMQDIAKEAGVSLATVSYIVNNRTDLKISPHTRKKVLQLCNLRQYKPSPIAQLLAGSKSNIIGICCNFLPGSPSHSCNILRLLKSLQSELQKENYTLRLLPDVSGDALPAQENIDGVICIGLSEGQFYTLKESFFVPIVAIDMTVEDTLFFKTYDDFRELVRRAKQALKAEKIIYVTEGHTNLPYMRKLERALANDTLYIARRPDDTAAFLGAHRGENIVFDGDALALLGRSLIDPAACAAVCRDFETDFIDEKMFKLYIPSALKAQAAVQMLKSAIDRKETEPHTYKVSPQ